MKNTFYFRGREYRPQSLRKNRFTVDSDGGFRVVPIAKGLAGIRQRVGIKQNDMAKRLGISPGQLSKFETGAKPMPRRMRTWFELECGQ